MHLTALCRARLFDTILLFDHAPRRYTPLVHCRRGAAPLAYSIGDRLPLRLLYVGVFRSCALHVPYVFTMPPLHSGSMMPERCMNRRTSCCVRFMTPAGAIAFVLSVLVGGVGVPCNDITLCLTAFQTVHRYSVILHCTLAKCFFLIVAVNRTWL